MMRECPICLQPAVESTVARGGGAVPLEGTGEPVEAGDRIDVCGYCATVVRKSKPKPAAKAAAKPKRKPKRKPSAKRRSAKARK
jgi:ribosome-binding protein aMBF1 (putative translation factor)